MKRSSARSAITLRRSIRKSKRDFFGAIKSADAVCAILAAALAALYFSPILHSSLSDADAYLRHVSAIVGFDRVTPLTVYDEIARHYRALQPGWFPLGPLPLALWLADPTERIVKLLQFGLVIVTFATFGILASKVFSSPHAALVSAVVALAAWQLRMPHDPVIGTSFTTTMLAEWILLAYTGWLAYRFTGRMGWLIVSCTTSMCAMLGGPLGWGFVALLAILAALDRIRGPVRFAWTISAVVIALVALFLEAPQPPWHRDGSYLKDVAAQIIAPIPASYRGFGSLHIGGIPGFAHGAAYVDDRFINVPAVDAWSWPPIFACTLVAFVSLSMLPRVAETRQLRTALYVGFGFWLLPALLLGPPGNWHGGLQLGQSFDGVYLQYFGIGILVTTGLLRLREGAGPIGRSAPSLFALAVFVLCYGNARSNAASIAKTQRSASSIDQIERAGAAGFFDILPAGRTVAVAGSEPFADGIHGSVSDAKYAIYHLSKRRYSVVSVESLKRSPKTDAWALSTSRTSGIFVSLAHASGFDGRQMLTDRAFGFSAIESIRQSLAVPARGVVITASRLKDGFAIRARRTCGPVARDLAYVGAVPTISWGHGFFARGPLGYERKSPQPDTEMFMGPTATLVLLPTTCSPRPLVFQAMIQAVGPANLITRVHDHTQRISLASTAPVVVRTAASRTPVVIHFTTDAPAADLDPIYFRYERDKPRDIRLRFFSAFAAEDLTSSRRRNARKES